MLLIAVAGIRLTARTQVAIALAEYLILIGFALAGLAAVLPTIPARSRHPSLVQPPRAAATAAWQPDS